MNWIEKLLNKRNKNLLDTLEEELQKMQYDDVEEEYQEFEEEDQEIYDHICGIEMDEFIERYSMTIFNKIEEMEPEYVHELSIGYELENREYKIVIDMQYDNGRELRLSDRLQDRYDVVLLENIKNCDEDTIKKICKLLGKRFNEINWKEFGFHNKKRIPITYKNEVH